MRRRSIAAVTAVAGLLTACGGGSTASTELAAGSAWSRPTPAAATTGVVYLTLTTDVVDSVVGASVPADIAGEAQLHTTMIDDGGGGGGGAHDHSGGDSSGSASMEDVESFAVTPDEPLVFEPGGNHIMLVDLPTPLEDGETFEITLELASGRSLLVPVVVSDNPPG